MLRIIDKYIFREIFNTWLIVMLTLLAVLLTNQFARILGDVAKDKLPKDSVMDLILLSGLQYLTILIPIGLFLSILMALGRLYSNSEMSAMMACKLPLPCVDRFLPCRCIPIWKRPRRIISSRRFLRHLSMKAGVWGRQDRAGQVRRRFIFRPTGVFRQ